MWAWPFIRKILIIVLLVWNVTLIVIVIKMHSRLSTVTMQTELLTKTQRKIVRIMDPIITNQETLMYLCSESAYLCSSVQEYLSRFHEDAEIVRETQKLYRRCYEPSH